MKTLRALPLLIALPLSLPATDAPPAHFVDPEATENAEIRSIGERAITRLAISLTNEVAVSLSKGGPASAVDVCHLKALPLTGEIIKDMPRITGVKRTSLRLRNPANAPDPAEQLALERVDRDISNGILPKVLVQRVTPPSGPPEWRVYRPVGIAPQCVACHGPRESLPADLQARLAERYPNDKATGYAAGQWRGLIRVSVSDTPPPAPPKATPAPTAKKK